MKLVVAFLLGLITWSGPTNPAISVKEKTVKISLAELAADPAAYNQKLVEITAFVSHGAEDFSLFDPAGPMPYQDFSVWLEYGGEVASGTIYCCGPTDARTRPEQLTVEDFAIPLVNDVTFRQFDELIHKPSDTTVRATLIGRFFSGKLEVSRGGTFWSGYGHLGCCSLLAVQQVTAFEPHDRNDLDYRSVTDQPHFRGNNCKYESVLDADLTAVINAQRTAEQTGAEWAFTDPQRVAAESLALALHRDPKSITGLRQKRTGPGRAVYEWGRVGRSGYYFIAVRRPYWLSFYAADSKRVAWITTTIDHETCY